MKPYRRGSCAKGKHLVDEGTMAVRRNRMQDKLSTPVSSGRFLQMIHCANAAIMEVLCIAAYSNGAGDVIF